MSLSKRVIETLVDLVEIKLSCIEVYDQEDSRELASLERCRRELLALLERVKGAKGDGAVVDFPKPAKGSRAAV
ncbi:MAG: hypothetical protein V3S40_11675 [Kiloniellales bacterium]